jgi:general secretion pathway protein G
MDRAANRRFGPGRGFSLVELVVSLTLVAILVGVFLDRALYYRELAEKSTMEQVALDLRSSVNLRVAELVLENRFADLKRLPEVNPIELLGRKPQNYLGVLPDGNPLAGTAGNWYFDKTLKEVVYFVDLGHYLISEKEGPKRIAWRVVLVRGADGKESDPAWARFDLVEPYRWF